MSKQALYVGNNGELSFTVRDNSPSGGGAVYDVSTLTRCIFGMAGQVVDSASDAGAFDWVSDGASGIIHIDLTGYAFASGSYGARVVIYNATYLAGLVVIDGAPVEVGQALAGTAAVPSDTATLHIAATAAHGATGAIVGTTNTQVLTNKTLTSPTINGGTIAGATLTTATLTAPAVADLTNMAHNHSNSAGGGSTLTSPTISGPTITGPTIGATEWAGANHAHDAANSGGTLTITKTELTSGCFASQAEMENWSANDVAVTPAKTIYHPGVAKGWARFNGTGSLSVSSSHNVTGVTDNGTGDYTITWATDFGDTNYCAIAYCDPAINNAQIARLANITALAAGTLQIACITDAVAAEDQEYVAVVAFGDFA